MKESHLPTWGEQKGTRWPIYLIQAQRWRLWVPFLSSASCPEVPEERKDTSGQHRRGGGLPQTSMPEPSPMEGTEGIKWHAWQLDMPALWQGLKEVPSQDNLQEFTRRVWASFELPKMQCCASKVDNYHSALPAHHSLDRDQFLPLPDMQFGSQDFWLTHAQKTLAYAKALQYWAEKAQPLIPSEPHHLAESVLELQQTMEPLTIFTDEEVLEDILLSNWVKITYRLAEPTQQEHSCSKTCQAHSSGSFSAAHGGTARATYHSNCPDNHISHPNLGGHAMTGRV